MLKVQSLTSPAVTCKEGREKITPPRVLRPYEVYGDSEGAVETLRKALRARSGQWEGPCDALYEAQDGDSEADDDDFDDLVGVVEIGPARRRI